MRYFNYPKWSKWIYPDAIWDFFSSPDKVLYLTFDDGPHPETTTWLLELLDRYEAKATFFCLGEQVKEFPELYRSILNNGHQVGNHSMNHPDGFKTSTRDYIQNVTEAKQFIDSPLFRPPYGRIKRKQYMTLRSLGYEICFWSVMTNDFDSSLSSDKRLKKVKNLARPGSILVFHESEKAKAQLKAELENLLKHFQELGCRFDAIQPDI